MYILGIITIQESDTGSRNSKRDTHQGELTQTIDRTEYRTPTISYNEGRKRTKMEDRSV